MYILSVRTSLPWAVLDLFDYNCEYDVLVHVLADMQLKISTIYVIVSL